MNYISTRDTAVKVSAASAIASGIFCKSDKYIGYSPSKD